MENNTKKIAVGLFIVIALIIIGYLVYTLYNYAIADATARIRQGVSEGVSEGIGSGIGDVINPIKWFESRR